MLFSNVNIVISYRYTIYVCNFTIIKEFIKFKIIIYWLKIYKVALEIIICKKIKITET